MCESWGLHKLAKHYYEESIEEMKHAEEVIDRILYLDGIPEIARYDIIHACKTLEEQISKNMEMEMKGSTPTMKPFRSASTIRIPAAGNSWNAWWWNPRKAWIGRRRTRPHPKGRVGKLHGPANRTQVNSPLPCV